MPFQKYHSRLSFKFVLLTTLLIVLTSLILALFLLRSRESDYLEFLKSRGIALTRILAFNSEYGEITHNTEVLAKLVQGILQETDVMYGVIHDAQGNILVESYRSEASHMKLPGRLIEKALALKLSLKKEESEEIFVQDFLNSSGENIGFDISAIVKTRRLARSHTQDELLPGYLGILDQLKNILKIDGQIIEEKIGTVRVGISLANLQKSILKIKRTISVITILVVFFGVIITTVLVQLIVRPIRRLVYGTRQIAQGNLNYEVQVSSKDEIGELAASFNQMTLFLKRSHEEVEEYRRMLEKMVEERTRKLRETEAELIRSEKFAAIGELITGITHELNNKLTPILGYAQIFKTMDLDVKVAKYMDIIEESAVNAKKIVESLLKFARTAPPQKIYVNLNQTMRETLDLVDPHIRKHHIDLHLNLDPELPMTMADPGLVSQAFLNMLNNAWQAMEEKGGILSVQSYQRDHKISFLIRDTGLGIPPENLARIFDPFFSTKEVGKGTGLGLSISYGIIQSHEGVIHVESRHGEGSTFTIELPIRKPQESFESKTSSENKKTISKRGKILVIEDELSVRTLLQDMLSPHHQVKVVSDGHQAKDIITQEKFDVYLVDLRMPVMDGRALYQWMTETIPSEAEKVIFITGDTYDKTTQTFLMSVPRPQLMKPFQMEALQNVIMDVLDRSSL